jgi:hypothetical protein
METLQKIHQCICGLGDVQGDQIGRIFAQLVIAYFGQYFENAEVAHINGLLFPWFKL